MTSFTKLIARNFIFPTFYFTGASSLFPLGSNNKRMVLTYHGVARHEYARQSGKPFTALVFEKHLQYFLQNFKVVSLQEMFRMYRENIVPDRKTIALTFDDGYENNYSVVYPLLKKYNLPATFFVSSVCISDPGYILWHDLLYLFHGTGVEELTIDGHCFKRSASYNYVDQGLQTNLHEFLKQLPAIRRDHLLEEMRKGYESHKKLRHEDEVSFKLLNSGQIRELAATDQIEIGSHAHAHYCLANVDELTVQRELMLSKQLLEEVAGKEVVSIAYPDSSYTETIKEQSLIAGYQNLLAVKYQLPQDVDDLSILPRHGLSPTTNFYSNIFFLHNAFKYTGF